MKNRSVPVAVVKILTMAMGLMGVSAAALASDAPVTAKLQLDLTPTYGADGAADGLAVKYVISDLTPTVNLKLGLDTMAPALQRVTDVVTELRVTDDHGVLPVTGPVSETSGTGTYTVWKASRAPVGTITVSYRMPVAVQKGRKSGPHQDLQQAGGGLSGAYLGFLALPMLDGAHFQAQVHWHMRPGEQAVTSYGIDDYAGSFTPVALDDTLFLAGKLQTYSPGGPSNSGGIHVYALGISTDAVHALGLWTARAYAAEKRAFKISGDEPYRFMIRSFEGAGPNSGRAAKNSFMLYLPAGDDPQNSELHSLVAHEMVHSLTRWLTPEATSDDEDWYGEGAADYFSIIIPYSVGLYSDAEYLALIRKESAGYYTNALRSIPNSEVATKMWGGRNAWLLPYVRGALYFADLDGKLKSHGLGVLVLDLVNEVSRRVNQGEATSAQTWVDILHSKAGDWAVSDWQKMMAGDVLFPVQGTFGKCAVSHHTDVRLFDLGFAKPVRPAKGATIEGVVPGSPAQQAGLRDGDVLTAGVDLLAIEYSLSTPVTLSVDRDGKPLTIHYDPHGHTVPGVIWDWACR